jgi:hypothetical protein
MPENNRELLRLLREAMDFAIGDAQRVGSDCSEK